MPYYISDENEKCSGWATVNDKGTVLGCHQTKEDAIKQMVAISVATGEPAAGDWKNR